MATAPPAKPATQFPFLITGRQLNEMTLEPPDWLVEDILLLNEKRMTLLAGQSGAGKSTFARALCAAVLKGEDFLGRKTRQCGVCYWQTEFLKRGAKAWTDKAGYDADRHAPLYTFNGKPSENTLENLHRVLEARTDIQLVVIETIQGLLHFKDVKENSFVEQAFNKFDEVMADMFGRIAFLGLTQLKKTELEKSGCMVLGATEIVARSGIKIYLRTKSDEDTRRIFHSTVRDEGQPFEATYLEHDADTGKVWFGETLKQEKQGRTVNVHERIESEIVKYVAGHPDAAEDAICRFVTGKLETKRFLIKKLVREGRLLTTGTGKKGNAIKYNVPAISIEGVPLEEQFGNVVSIVRPAQPTQPVTAEPSTPTSTHPEERTPVTPEPPRTEPAVTTPTQPPEQPPFTKERLNSLEKAWRDEQDPAQRPARKNAFYAAREASQKEAQL